MFFFFNIVDVVDLKVKKYILYVSIFTQYPAPLLLSSGVTSKKTNSIFKDIIQIEVDPLPLQLLSKNHFFSIFCNGVDLPLDILFVFLDVTPN